jgi:hypothetical protein
MAEVAFPEIPETVWQTVAWFLGEPVPAPPSSAVIAAVGCGVLSGNAIPFARNRPTAGGWGKVFLTHYGHAAVHWLATRPDDRTPPPESRPEWVTEAHERVLRYLLEMYPRLRQQEDIATSTGLARQTVKDALDALRERGYVHRPEGDRKGDGLTNQGKQLAEHLKSLPPLD